MPTILRMLMDLPSLHLVCHRGEGHASRRAPAWGRSGIAAHRSAARGRLHIAGAGACVRAGVVELEVEAVEEAVCDGGEHDAHDRQERDTAEDRVERREEL